MTRTRAIIIVLTFWSFAAYGSGTPEQKCQTGKNITAAKYVACRAKAEGKLASGGSVEDYQAALGKCDGKFSTKWQKLEQAAVDAATSCPSMNDASEIRDLAAAQTSEVAFEVSGLPRFADNHDGTITDRRTGLMWEKKIGLDLSGDASDFGNPHDADNAYAWSANCGAACQVDSAAIPTCTAESHSAPLGCSPCSFTCQVDANIPNAYTLWTWLNNLNTTQFAGYSDWRIPSRNELRSIVAYDQVAPAVDSAFHGANCGAACTDLNDPACSCTSSAGHWTVNVSVTQPPPYSDAWQIVFGTSGEQSNSVTGLGRARAVRGTCAGCE